MKVEVFEEKELLADGDQESFVEAKALVESLGLEGQKEFMTPSDKERAFYRKMTRQEFNVYTLLLSGRAPLNRFAECPIPLRVLQVAAHATTAGFAELEVWHQESADMKDPLLVAYKRSKWDGEPFLLARWGEALAPMVELVERARAIGNARALAALAKVRAQVAEREASVDALVQAFVLGQERALLPSISLEV